MYCPWYHKICIYTTTTGLFSPNQKQWFWIVHKWQWCNQSFYPRWLYMLTVTTLSWHLWCYRGHNPFRYQVSTCIPCRRFDNNNNYYYWKFPTVLSFNSFCHGLPLVIFGNCWMMPSMIWRLLQIKEWVIVITHSEICIILHIIPKLNSVFVSLFIKNIGRVKDKRQCTVFSAGAKWKFHINISLLHYK